MIPPVTAKMADWGTKAPRHVRTKTRGGARPGVRYYDKMTIDFTHSHVVLQYRTSGSGKFTAGGWKVISGRFPGRGPVTRE